MSETDKTADWSAWANARPGWRFYISYDQVSLISFSPESGAGGILIPDGMVYADPVCGIARFSVHSCNGNGPSRAQYLEYISSVPYVSE